MGFTRACFQLDGNDPEAIEALMMEHNGWGMTELPIFSMEDDMPSDPVLLRGFNFESLVWHSSGWIRHKDIGGGWFSEFTIAVSLGGHYSMVSWGGHV